MNDQEYSKHRDGKTWCNMCIRSSTLPCCFFRWLSCYMGKALTTAFIFISTRKWIGKSSFCKLYGFFLYLLYFEAIFGNSNMLLKKPRQLYFTSLTLFYISTWGWAGKFKRSASNPSPAPRGVQSMMCPCLWPSQGQDLSNHTPHDLVAVLVPEIIRCLRWM